MAFLLRLALLARMYGSLIHSAYPLDLCSHGDDCETRGRNMAMMDEADRQLPQAAAAMRHDMVEMRHDMVEMQGQMVELRADVSALVKTTRRPLQADVEGVQNVGREIVHAKSDSTTWFMKLTAGFDQIDAELVELRDRPAS